MAPPLALPRSLFIASLALAGASAVPMAPLRRMPGGAARIERQARSVRVIFERLGRAITEAGRELAAFRARGALWVEAVIAAPAVDPRVRVLMRSAEIAKAVGAVASFDDGVSPWASYSTEPPRVTLAWRGTWIEGQGPDDESIHERSRAHFAEAILAARRALAAADHQPSSFVDIKWIRREGFTGYLGTIGLLRARPVWLAPAKGFAR